MTFSGWKRALFLGEAGDRAGSARAAKATLDQFAAFTHNEQVQGDIIVSLYAFMQRGGLISRVELLKRRDAWVAGVRAKTDDVAWKELGFIVWTKAYSELFVYGDLTDADARDAIAVLPKFGQIPAAGSVDDDLPTGITLHRAGRVAEAPPPRGRRVQPRVGQPACQPLAREGARARRRQARRLRGLRRRVAAVGPGEAAVVHGG